MTDQDLPRVVPNTPGGDEKTVTEVDLADLLPDKPRHGPQPSDEGPRTPYTPIIIDLPATS